MSEPWKPTEGERELLELLKESALHDYPNPERQGCPGRDFLRQLAFHRSSIPATDPRVDHVVHCSPCFREFTEIREQTPRKHLPALIVAAAAAAVLAIVLAVWMFTRTRSGETITHPQTAQERAPILKPIAALIDFRKISVTRGASQEPRYNTPKVPRGLLDLTILLPFGTEAGKYDVEIQRQVDKALVTTSGTAVIVDGITTLRVRLNTSNLPPNRYLLGARRPPLDWVFAPVTLE
jgi:hypothetical protein